MLIPFFITLSIVPKSSSPSPKYSRMLWPIASKPRWFDLTTCTCKKECPCFCHLTQSHFCFSACLSIVRFAALISCPKRHWPRTEGRLDDAKADDVSALARAESADRLPSVEHKNWLDLLSEDILDPNAMTITLSLRMYFISMVNGIL